MAKQGLEGKMTREDISAAATRDGMAAMISL